MRVRQNGKLFSSAVVALLSVTAGTLSAQDVRYNFRPRALCALAPAMHFS